MYAELNLFPRKCTIDTVARAAVIHKPLSAEHIVAAMKARITKMAEPASGAGASADATGLFN